MLNDWYALGMVQYRKWHVYDMSWSLSESNSELSQALALENYQVCGAPFGGPIALFLDPRRNPSESHLSKPAMHLAIYSSAGAKLSDIEWSADQRLIVGMGWTDHEYLVVITENGMMKLFDLNGKVVLEIPILENSNSNVQILECHFWGNGCAVMTSENIIKLVEGISANDLISNRPRVYSLRTGLGSERSYTAMAVIPPLLSRSGFVEVLLGTSDRSVLVVHEHGNDAVIEDQLLHQKLGAPINKIALAPDGRFVACYRKDGILTVMSSNFNTKVVDFDTRSASKPIAIAWCGKDAVIMQWRNTGLVMVGPFGDWINFPYDTPGIHVIPEIDSCRIVTSTSCEILQLVPSATVAALEIGSMEPAALILDAMDAFEEGDPKSDENIRTIASANQLHEAVGACIQAAAAEYHPAQQQRLMKAASYGKAFCPDMDPTEFVEVAKKLRVLNDIRRPEIGLPLTVQQYNRLTPEVLVGRLTTRNKHFLALKICELLRLKNDRVLIHWACEKVKKMSSQGSVSDEEISRTIKAQLEPYGRVSLLGVAKVAYNIGRRRLATIILDKEQHPDSQIPLLLEMNEDDLALQKAINSEDTDLIYFTLINLEARVNPNKQSLDNFFRIVHNYPEAANLLRIYYRNKIGPSDRSILQNLLIYGKNYQEAGNAAALQSLTQVNAATKIQLLKEASNLYSQGRDSAFYKSMADEYIDLIETQKNLEMRSQSRRDFSNCSLNETIHGLIELGIEDPGEQRWIEQEIQKLVKRYKVADKTIYYMKINILSERNDWSALAKFAAEKKPPVGFRPFAVACLKFGAPASEAEKYIEKVTVPEDKYELYMESKAFQRAVDVAIKMRDAYRLNEIARLCQDPVLERFIQDSMQKL